MTTTDHLTALLAEADIEDAELDAEAVVRLCQLLGLEASDPLTEEVIDEVARTGEAAWPDIETRPDEYGFRVGQWKVEIGRNGVRAGILTAIAAAALIQRGVAEVGIAFATAVLPTVLDVERIVVSPGDRRLLIDLRLKEGVRNGFMSEDELYQCLPDAAKLTVNRYDFADFVGRLRDAGLVEGNVEWLRPRHPDDRGPLISLR